MTEPASSRVRLKTSMNGWNKPPQLLSLAQDEVHVWRTSLDVVPSTLDALTLTLAPDELQRANRFRFYKGRLDFIVARGALRAILARYLRTDPRELRFAYGSHGKPELAGNFGEPMLRFNLSHAHRLALFAISSGREVGIDVEWVRPEFAGEQIAESFFSRREVLALRSLPPEKQTEAFFNCWTRKEAYIKARGEGLSIPLDKFQVSLTPGEPAELLRVEGDPKETARWIISELMPGTGYVAALAVSGAGWKAHGWDLALG
jgi:4'-phosphopantetheinyl transferase